MSGYIRIARNLWSDEAFADAPFSEREAWVWLIAEASWKPRKKRVGDVVVSLERGQLAHSTRFLADTWSWSHSKTRRYLDRIEKLDLIRRETDTGVSVITLCNYEKYQGDAQTSDTDAAQERHTSGTNYKKGEIKKEDNICSFPASGGFPEFWDAWPRKVGRGQAEKAYRTARKSASHEQIMAGLSAQLPALAAREAKFRPHASTWLNGKRWEDEAEAVEPAATDMPPWEFDKLCMEAMDDYQSLGKKPSDTRVWDRMWQLHKQRKASGQDWRADIW